MGHSLPKKQSEADNLELEKAKAHLAEAKTETDYIAFYQFFKNTSLPYIPCEEKRIPTLHLRCFEVLEELGQISIPVAVALSMHYYVLSAIASYPLAKTGKSFWKRELLLNKIKKEQALIANTGSVRTYDEVTAHPKIWATQEASGYLVKGKAPFMSLSGIADYLVFTATLDKGQQAVFFAPYVEDQIIFGNKVFGEAMLGSFTKSLTFQDLEVPYTSVIGLEEGAKGNEENEPLVYQRAWFQSLAAAPYLGGAYAVIRYLQAFGQQKVKNGEPLSTSENFQKTVGGLIMKYKAAKQLSRQSGFTLADFKKAGRITLKELFEASVLAKYYGTQFAEEIVARSRQVIGTSFLQADSFGAKINQQITFGTAQPMTHPDILEYFAKGFNEA